MLPPPLDGMPMSSVVNKGLADTHLHLSPFWEIPMSKLCALSHDLDDCSQKGLASWAVHARAYLKNNMRNPKAMPHTWCYVAPDSLISLLIHVAFLVVLYFPPYLVLSVFHA